jgi:hypothetical protein
MNAAGTQRTMALRELLREKVPGDVQLTHEYKAFLSLVKKANISDLATLQAYLDQESAACASQLRQHQAHNLGGTQNRLLRALAKKHEFLKLIQDKILSYLE